MLTAIITVGSFFLASASLGAAVMLYIVQRDEIKRQEKSFKTEEQIKQDAIEREKFWDDILCKGKGR